MDIFAQSLPPSPQYLSARKVKELVIPKLQKEGITQNTEYVPRNIHNPEGDKELIQKTMNCIEAFSKESLYFDN